MKEEFIVYIWQYSLFDHRDLLSEEGEKIEIINKGTRNYNSGPDFKDAKIKVGDTVWFGNVEIHSKSSDWHLHKHSSDKAYDNVILHVVLQNDKKIKDHNGNFIPTLRLQNKINAAMALQWQQMNKSKKFIACEKNIHLIDDFTWLKWKERLLIERLERKVKLIKSILESTRSDWDEAFYICLARSFGMKVNQEPFEQLAKSLPLKILQKCSKSLKQTNALMFGQAGMLFDINKDEYYMDLCSEYSFYSKAFKLHPIQEQSWKFSKLRPSNFPTIRIAQLAYIMFNNYKIFSKILECNSLSAIQDLFYVDLDPFWINHYTFDRKSGNKEKKIGDSMMNSIIINAILPFLFLYHKETNYKLKISPIEILYQIKAEKNSVVKKFEDLKVSSKSAFDSQALIHLHKNYCFKLQCLKCAVGKKVIGT